MSFLFKDRPVVPPVGTIIQYIGTTDPPGWIICNGIKRTEQDGRFAALADVLNNMEDRVRNSSGFAIVNDENNCTPPDLSGRIMYGKSGTDKIGKMTGNKMKTLEANNLPSHAHLVTDRGHNHGGFTGYHDHGYSENPHNHNIRDPGHSHTYEYRKDEPGMKGLHNATWKHTKEAITDAAATGITLYDDYSKGSIENSTAPINKGKTNITVNNTGSGSAFNIMPPYFVIHYIIKY